MTARRFYAPPQSFSPDKTRVTLDAEESHHLRAVLRLSAGDAVAVFDGAGREYKCLIVGASNETGEKSSKRAREVHQIELRVMEEIAAPHAESPLRLTLAVALLKNEKFDLVVQKATELGASKIVPIETLRADVKLAANSLTRISRWQRVALEAAKQSGRAFVPHVSEAVTFAKLIEEQKSDECLMFTEQAGGNLFDAVARWREASNEFSNEKAMTAIVGSEGGWVDAEIEQARGAGWSLVTLGGRTLRAETAAITVAALLQHLCGDLL